MKSQRLLVISLAFGIMLVGFAAASAFSYQQDHGGKIEVKTVDDLPVHTYPLDGSVSDLLGSPEAFAAFKEKVRANLESDLEKYDIKDTATLQDIHRTLLAIDMLEGNDEAVLEKIEIIRKLEEKEAVRLTSGLVAQSYVAANREVDRHLDPDAFREAFKGHFSKRVFALPWDVVQDRIQEGKGMAEILSETLLMGIVQSRLDPTVEATGELSRELAARVVNFRAALDINLPLKGEMIAVYQEMIDRHHVVKADIWAARDYSLEAARDLEPVVVGIWDSGMDCPVFAKAMYVNPGEKMDGKDSDGNGFVDDVHGIAFGLDGERTPELLFPLGEDADRIDDAMAHMKGFMDLQAAIDSPEASGLKAHLGSVEPSEIKGFIEGLGLCGLYAHGTHVAGIAAAGNPFARLLNARITFDFHQIPEPLTIELARKHARSYGETVAYFREHGVRVVNMSWGWTFREIETGLEANGVGETAEKRAKLAREILDILSDGLSGAIASTPEILYVSAAGNEDSDVEFDTFIPASFELPNLLVVGAVDQAGERTDFTSTGENVVVYSNGFEVDSFVPGGGRMAMSGTSMSAPNVTNLAAKLIALKPELKPTRTIELIKEGSDQLKEQPDLMLVNPKATVALLEGQP